MEFFDIDEQMIVETIANAMDAAGYQASEEQFNQIIDKIDQCFPGLVSAITVATQENWKAEAMSVSTGWGAKYANAIVTNGKDEVYIDESLVDKTTNKPNMMFVEMVENGMRSFSIKDALMKSKKAKISADGVRYIIVPFPVATPRQGGSGNMSTKFGGREMTQEAYKIVKSGGKFSGSLKSGGEASGLTQYTTNKFHSQYGMFLCVSENSKGWIHPGVSAEPVFQKVLKNVNKQIQELLSGFCEAIVKEYAR